MFLLRKILLGIKYATWKTLSVLGGRVVRKSTYIGLGAVVLLAIVLLFAGDIG